MRGGGGLGRCCRYKKRVPPHQNTVHRSHLVTLITKGFDTTSNGYQLCFIRVPTVSCIVRPATLLCCVHLARPILPSQGAHRERQLKRTTSVKMTI